MAISEELIAEILFRLSVKSVARFNCVSKKWNHLISHDPYFRKNYREVDGSPRFLGFFHHQNYAETRCLSMFDQGKLSLLAIENEEEDTTKSLLNFLGHEKLFLVASSNGVLLLSSHGRFEAWKYIICNPITKQWMNLPPPKHTNGKFFTSFICKSFHNLFQYTVLRTVCPEASVVYSATVTIEILEGDGNDHAQWKEFNLTYPRPFNLRSDGALGIISEKSGLVYWPVNIEMSNSFKLTAGLLVFYLNRQEEHQLEIILFPPIISGGNFWSDYQHRRFGQSNGLFLSVVHTFHDIYVWVLDQDERTWSLQYKVENLQEQFVCLLAFHPFHPHLVFVGMDDGSKALLNLETKNVQESFPSHEQGSISGNSFSACMLEPVQFEARGGKKLKGSASGLKKKKAGLG